MLQVLQAKHTFGPDTFTDPYPLHIIRTTLTRSLATLYPDIQDELAAATRELIPPSDGT